MKAQRVVGGLLAGIAVLLGGGYTLLREPATAMAQDESEYVSNPVIDCSTNPNYRDNYIADAFKQAGHDGQNQQCTSCHQSAHPAPGQGDRPKLEQGTVLVQNRSSEAVRYEVRSGRSGEWKPFELKPGQMVRHTYKYDRAGQ